MTVAPQLLLVKSIDKGGFGSVDLVKDVYGNHFAKKTFSPNQPLNAELLENVRKRFVKEIRVQESISHPNILPILSKNLDVWPPYYIMPLAVGSLAADIKNDRILGGGFVRALSDIISGLDEIHSMQIYHRDLKPQNVLRLQSNDGSGSYYYALSDFGLISMRESSISNLTVTGMAKGSDYYTAPEIAKDLKHASVHTDIYSLGCILHDMVGTDDRMPLGEIREPGPFSDVLLGCTRKKPSDRFKSAKAVLDAILSIEFSPAAPANSPSVDFVAVLDGVIQPSLDFLPRLADFLEHASGIEQNAVFARFSSDWIDWMCATDIDVANRLGVYYASWIQNSAFSFETCDALSNRLEQFFVPTMFDTKVACLFALLDMGTSHNRWHVERKFARLCSPLMENNLAKRFAMEIRIRGDEVCQMISHLERSISVSRATFHPLIVQALTAICP